MVTPFSLSLFFSFSLSLCLSLCVLSVSLSLSHGMTRQAFLGCSYNEKVDVYAWSHVVAEMLSLDVVSENRNFSSLPPLELPPL